MEDKDGPSTRLTPGDVALKLANQESAIQALTDDGKKAANQVKEMHSKMDEQKDQMQKIMDLLTELQKSRPPPPPPPSSAQKSPLVHNTTAGGGPDPPKALPARPPDVRSIQKLTASVTRCELKTWRVIWDSMANQISLDDFPVQQQFGALLTRMDVELLQLVELKCEVDLKDNGQTPKAVLDKLEAYLGTLEHAARDRLHFNKRIQQEGESINQFYMALEKLATQADICKKCRDHVMSVQLLGGLHNDDIRREILKLDPFPELKDVLKKCLSEEMSRKDQKNFKVQNMASVAAVKERGRGQSRGPPANRGKSQNRSGEKCQSCGSIHRGRDCPAKGRECQSCGRTGHFKAVCKNKPKIQRITIQSVFGADRAPHAEVILESDQCKGVPHLALPDTGAEICVMDSDIAMGIGLFGPLLQPTSYQIESANKEFVVLGEVTIDVSYKEKLISATFVVCEDFKGLVLSWKVAEELGIVSYDPELRKKILKVKHKVSVEEEVPEDPTEEEIAKFKAKLMEDFKDVFTQADEVVLKPQKCPPMKIHLKEGAKPVYCSTPRKLEIAYREPTKACLDEMQTQKVIAKEEEPTEWCHPMVVVPKKDGTVRVCADMRAINEAVERPTYPVRTPKEAVTSVPQGMKFFSTADAAKGYWQMLVVKDSQKYTTFMTPWGPYKYLRAPMGFIATGNYYNQETDKLFEGGQDMTKVVDDRSRNAPSLVP